MRKEKTGGAGLHPKKRRKGPSQEWLQARTKFFYLLDIFETLFRNTGNPLYAWKVRSMCRQSRTPVPPWVRVYLDNVGQKLLAEIDKRSSKAAADAAASALGFKNAKNGFSGYRKLEDAAGVTFKFMQARRTLSANKSYEKLEEANIPISTSKRRMREIKKALGCTTEDLARRFGGERTGQ